MTTPDLRPRIYPHCAHCIDLCSGTDNDQLHADPCPGGCDDEVAEEVSRMTDGLEHPFFAPEVIESALWDLDNYAGSVDDGVEDAQTIMDALHAAGFKILRDPS